MALQQFYLAREIEKQKRAARNRCAIGTSCFFVGWDGLEWCCNEILRTGGNTSKPNRPFLLLLALSW
uniref:Uncharacterized protein n=1 Tax=Globisporangium ultimum (strain ATCC 200006 / CBS 805.95 / DAOM BR144) TaxID=431595 RepID=K3WIR5_GLOUD